MHHGCSRQHFLSRHVRRNKIEAVLADMGKDPEPCWYDDDYDHAAYEALLEKDYEEWKAEQAEQEWLDDDFYDDEYYDRYEGDWIDAYREPGPSNLTRDNAEWKF